MTLLGLDDDYEWDGRAIDQILEPWATPWTIRVDQPGYEQLSAAYKQLNAPFGQFGLDTLNADTSAVESNSPGDVTYTGTDAQLQACQTARSALAAQIQPVLQNAETGRFPINPFEAQQLTAKANALIGDAATLSSSSIPPATPVC